VKEGGCGAKGKKRKKDGVFGIGLIFGKKREKKEKTLII